MKIVHIITNLGDGGAENTLFKICKYDKSNEHIVISIKSTGKYAPLLKRSGIKVYCLNFKFYSFLKFFLLIKMLRHLKPDILQTWLVHGDFIGGIAGKLAGLKNIIWNIRYSDFKFKNNLVTIFIVKLLAKLSFLIPKMIVVVSKKAKKISQLRGYDNQKLILISNGYDLSILKPNKSQTKNLLKPIKKKYQ